MTCKTCISFKRTAKTEGLCFSVPAIRHHFLNRADRMGVRDDYTCPHHENKAQFVESLKCQFRAAFHGVGARD